MSAARPLGAPVLSMAEDHRFDERSTAKGHAPDRATSRSREAKEAGAAVRALEATFLVELMKAADFGGMAAGVGNARTSGADIVQGMVHEALGKALAGHVELGISAPLREALGTRLGADPSTLARPELRRAPALVEVARLPQVSSTRAAETLAELLVEDASARVSSGFGTRADPLTHEHRMHHGIDIAAPRGAPVRAAIAGTVTFAGTRSGYGHLVEVTAGDGRVARYAHLDAIAVSVGTSLSAGSAIGTVGSSGRSTGNHLHFEVRKAGSAVDPLEALRNSEGRADR